MAQSVFMPLLGLKGDICKLLIFKDETFTIRF